MELPIGDPEHLQELLNDSVACLSRLYRTYGEVVAFPSDRGLTVFAFGTQYNHAIFTDPRLAAFSGCPGPKGSSQRIVHYGLFGLFGENHLRHRRLLMPLFRKERVDGSFDAMAALVEQAISGWQPGEVIDLVSTLQAFALEVTGRLLFGLEELRTARAVAEVFQEWLQLYSMLFFSFHLPLEAPAGSYDRMLSLADELVGHFRELIRQRRETLQPGQMDVLALLLRSLDSGVLSDREVIGEMHTMVNAAYQTTSFSLMWMLFLLAQHPAAARALLNEQNDVLAGAMLEPRHLPRLEWLNAVVRESLRILPPVVHSHRVSTHEMPLGRYRLPAGALVVPSYYVTHHMPSIFSQPERFLPERWRGAEVSPYAYLPFSAGSRMCLGAGFSTLLFKIAVTRIWQRFRLEVLPGTRIDRQANLTLGSRDKLPVRLWPQDGRFATSLVIGNIHEMVELPAVARQRAA